MDKIVYGLDLSEDVANNNMKIIINELDITEDEIKEDDNEE